MLVYSRSCCVQCEYDIPEKSNWSIGLKLNNSKISNVRIGKPFKKRLLCSVILFEKLATQLSIFWIQALIICKNRLMRLESLLDLARTRPRM